MAKSKYGNRKTDVAFQGEVYPFDSIAEADHFRLLLQKLKRGEITNLKLQPIYKLTKPFIIATDKNKSGKSKIGVSKYIADFSYTDTTTGRKITVDVKGMTTNLYNLKKRLFLAIAFEEYGINDFIEVFKDEQFTYECSSVLKV